MLILVARALQPLLKQRVQRLLPRTLRPLPHAGDVRQERHGTPLLFEMSDTGVDPQTQVEIPLAARLRRVEMIEAAGLSMVCGRARARAYGRTNDESYVALAVEAYQDAARLYRAAGLSVMADRAERCIVAVMAMVERPAVTT